MNRQDAVIAYIEALHANRHIVAESYHRGFIDSVEGGPDAKGINVLKGYRALVPRTQDSSRLRTSLRDHLDDVLLKSRLYTAVGSGIADQVARLAPLFEEVRNALLEGRTDDAARYSDDFSAAVFELADNISMSLDHMRTQADTKFSHVTTLEEKQRQNEHYIKRAEAIGAALESLSDGRLLETFGELTLNEELGQLFRGQLWEHLPQWRSSLLDITKILKDFLYRLRQIAPATRRFRAFALHLKRNVDWQAPALEEAERLINPCRRAAPIAMQASAEANDERLQAEYIAIAQRLPAPRRYTPRAAPIGELATEKDGAVPMEVALHEFQRAWRRFLPQVLTQGDTLSALKWKRAQADWGALSEELWLIWVVNECSGGAGRQVPVRAKLVHRPLHPLSGNLVLHDVEVARR